MAITRDLGLHAATFVTGAVAAITVMASHQVDLYAAFEHVHSAVQELMAAWTLIGPVVIAAYAAYKATTKQKALDVLADPKAPDKIKDIPVTPQVVAVAEALKTNSH